MIGDPYGVPTGYVPRDVIVSPLSQQEAAQTLRQMAAAVDPVARAVENYMLMERKARAWDALLERGHAVPRYLVEMVLGNVRGEA
jgi:hypothetical protein